MGNKKKKKILSVLSSTALAGSLFLPFGSTAEAVVGTTNAGTTYELHDHEQLYDVRNTLRKVVPSKDQLYAANSLMNSLGSGVRIQWNSMFGTPAMITNEKGYLSNSQAGDAVTIAKNWLKKHAALFGLSETEIDTTLKVIRNYKMPGTGLQPVTFQQTFEGIESIFGGRVIVAVNKEGKILSVSGNLSKAKNFKNSYSLTASEALIKVIKLENPSLSFTPTTLGTQNDWDVFSGEKVFPTEQYVKKAVFALDGVLIPVYRVLYLEKLDKGTEIVINAENGEKLYERPLAYHLNPEGSIFENYPGALGGGTLVKKSFKGDPDASPLGWLLPESELGVTTFGNNASAFANWSNFLVPADQAVRPIQPLGQFHYPFNNSWQKTKGQTLPPSYADDLNSASVNLFYHHNLFHDYFYKLGWIEGAGNLQAANFGKGGQEGDPIMGLVQAGALTGGEPTYTGRDNAYMLTLPDGLPAWSGMFLWEPIPGAFEGEYADGDYDAGIIYHEYSHALSNRLVAGGEALGSHQSGSMGEAWGDWFAMHYLVKSRKGYKINQLWAPM